MSSHASACTCGRTLLQPLSEAYDLIEANVLARQQKQIEAAAAAGAASATAAVAARATALTTSRVATDTATTESKQQEETSRGDTRRRPHRTVTTMTDDVEEETKHTFETQIVSSGDMMLQGCLEQDKNTIVAPVGSEIIKYYVHENNANMSTIVLKSHEQDRTAINILNNVKKVMDDDVATFRIEYVVGKLENSPLSIDDIQLKLRGIPIEHPLHAYGCSRAIEATCSYGSEHACSRCTLRFEIRIEPNQQAIAEQDATDAPMTRDRRLLASDVVFVPFDGYSYNPPPRLALLPDCDLQIRLAHTSRLVCVCYAKLRCATEHGSANHSPYVMFAPRSAKRFIIDKTFATFVGAVDTHNLAVQCHKKVFVSLNNETKGGTGVLANTRPTIWSPFTLGSDELILHSIQETGDNSGTYQQSINCFTPTLERHRAAYTDPVDITWKNTTTTSNNNTSNNNNHGNLPLVAADTKQGIERDCVRLGPHFGMQRLYACDPNCTKCADWAQRWASEPLTRVRTGDIETLQSWLSVAPGGTPPIRRIALRTKGAIVLETSGVCSGIELWNEAARRYNEYQSLLETRRVPAEQQPLQHLSSY